LHGDGGDKKIDMSCSHGAGCFLCSSIHGADVCLDFMFKNVNVVNILSCIHCDGCFVVLFTVQMFV